MIFIIMNLNEQISRIRKLIYEQTQDEFVYQNEFNDELGKLIKLVSPELEQIGYINLINNDRAKDLDPDFNRLYSNQDWCKKNCEKDHFNKDNTLFAHSLWVEPKFRRQGNSEKIMNHCIDMAKNNGFKYVTLITNKDNIPAQSLYNKLGFDTHVSDDSQIFYFRPV